MNIMDIMGKVKDVVSMPQIPVTKEQEEGLSALVVAYMLSGGISDTEVQKEFIEGLDEIWNSVFKVESNE